MATTNNVIPNNKAQNNNAPNNKAQNNNTPPYNNNAPPNNNGMFNDSLALHNIAEGRFDKMDKTNVPVLLEALNDDNPFFILNVIDELEKLSNTNPDDFLRYDPLFPALHHTHQNPILKGGGSSAVFNILKNISQTAEAKRILNAKFDIFLAHTSSSPHLIDFKANLTKMGILKIFDMRAITASEKPQVYGITGHGCVYDKRPAITVPKGVVWIELAVCGKTMYLNDLRWFIKDAVKTFLDDTPIPTEKFLQNKYRIDLGKLVGYDISVKFPGQAIADGTNTVFAQGFDRHRELDIYFRSGIRRFYTSMDKSQGEPVDRKVVSYDNGHYLLDDESYEKIYADSLYPTVEQVIQNKPNQLNYKICFKDMFQQIESQEYEARSPMILIHFGCRSPCVDSLEGPALRRANSIERKEELVRTLPIGELLKVDARGQTYLELLIKDELLDLAKILVERIEVETGPGTLINYFNAGQGNAMKLMTLVSGTHESPFQSFLIMKYKAARILLKAADEERAFEDAVKYRYADGRTELMNMLQHTFYPKAKLFINEFETKKGSDAFAAYLTIQDKSSRSVLTMLDARDFPPDLRELIISKIPVEMRAMIKPATATAAPAVSVAKLFNNLDTNNSKDKLSQIILELGRRAIANVDDVLRYDGLFSSLQRVLDKNVKDLDSLINGLIGKIQTSAADKSALSEKFRAYVAVAGVSAKLQKILTMKGAITKAGSRKKKYFRKNRSTRRKRTND